MRKRASFWLPDSLSHFPMGRTLTPLKWWGFPLQLMGNKFPQVMHNVFFLMPLHENVDVSSEMWLHICFTPLGYLMLIWAVWELILRSFPLLSAGQPRAGDRPWIIQEWRQPESATGLQTNVFSYFSPGDVSALFFLQCSWSPNSWWLGGNAVSFVSAASQLFAGGRTACGGRQINWLYSWADWWCQLTVPKVGIFMLRLPGSIESSQPSLLP